MAALKASEGFSYCSSSPSTPTGACSGPQQSTSDLLSQAPEHTVENDASTTVHRDGRADCRPIIGNEASDTESDDSVAVQNTSLPLSRTPAVDVGKTDNSDKDLIKVLSQCNTTNATPGTSDHDASYGSSRHGHASGELPVDSLAMSSEDSTEINPWEEDIAFRVEQGKDVRDSNGHMTPPMPQIHQDQDIRSPHDFDIQGGTEVRVDSSLSGLCDSRLGSMEAASEGLPESSSTSGSASGMDEGSALGNLEQNSDRVHNAPSDSAFSSFETTVPPPDLDENFWDSETSVKQGPSGSAAAEGALAVNPVDVLVEVLSGLYTAATNQSGSGKDRLYAEVYTGEPESEGRAMPSATQQDPVNTFTQMATITAAAAGILTGGVAQTLIDMVASSKPGPRHRVQACHRLPASTTGYVNSEAGLQHQVIRCAGKQCYVHAATTRG